MLLRLGQVDDELGVLLQDHAPEVLLGLGQRPLRGDEGRVVDFDGGVDVVGVDVGVGYVGVPLHEPHPRVLEGLQVLVPVQIEAAGVLVGEVLLRLGQLSEEPELRVEVSHQRLPFVVVQGDALFQNLDLVELLDPLVGQVLRRLVALDLR